jgi:BlaI family transcriptional regulator, penicillinase repressor
MPRSARDVTETELEVLEVLWDSGPATVRQVVERVYPGSGPSAPPTVQKLMERLESKGFVTRDRSGEVQRFAAAVDRAAIVNARLRSVAEELCGGSLTSLLIHLMQAESLSKSERKALRALVDEWDRPERTGTKRGS